MKKYTFTFIDDVDKLVEFRKYLRENKITKIAMDFEGEHNLHSYGEKLCLIQIFDGEKYFLMDPLKIEDIEISKTLENSKITKYMYSAESDKSLIYKQYGIKLKNVLDLKTLVDVLNFENKGLDGIINSLFGIENKFKTKYQKHNWQKRPIDENAITYALDDVNYLFKIYDVLIEKIIREDKINELLITVINNEYDYEKMRKATIFKKKEFNDLNENNKKEFMRIYEIREFYAKKLNLPPHNLIENSILFEIANNKINVNTLKFNKKISKDFCKEIIRKIQNKIN